jgi:hypothetical protein
LTGIIPYNILILRPEKILVEKEETLGNLLKPKDIIQFELEFREIWLEVEMTLTSENECLKIGFELKVQTEFFISHLKDILIKMGIKFWAAYNEERIDEKQYYLFNKFSLIYSDKEGNLLHKEMELDNLHGIYKFIFLNRKN